MKGVNIFAVCFLFFSFLTGCATQQPKSENIPQAVLPGIPDGAIHVREKIFRLQPPEDSFDFAVFWYQIAALHQAPDANKNLSGIIVKSCRITCMDSNGKKIFERNFAGDTLLGPELGGLYDRNPWFKSDKHTPIFAQRVLPEQGLVINASLVPDKIVHWWTERFRYNSRNKYKVEMKVKIIGDTALQIGGDYWKGASSPHTGWDAECRGTNNCEAFVSEWYGDTKGKYITITKEL
ncbi:hypothetical protein L6270_03550 [Candidatus Parcubacteria bacterium]|nr:hypothetical protein [Patescibacteria group bacterium]MBU4309039.1 hypothetical protein [Patescibacteria group bacterium]MBU4431962.1 hypothetical protein [Patescibacteria group bacterium]MBU4577400.1 hypothetical protein [Patescibacteria group bacterium]MCG2697088.1 hypothetical protein [Candidatus Parcubacteria bacterium]